jgi:hypothetical protein
MPPSRRARFRYLVMRLAVRPGWAGLHVHVAGHERTPVDALRHARALRSIAGQRVWIAQAGAPATLRAGRRGAR